MEASTKDFGKKERNKDRVVRFLQVVLSMRASGMQINTKDMG